MHAPNLDLTVDVADVDIDDADLAAASEKAVPSLPLCITMSSC